MNPRDEGILRRARRIERAVIELAAACYESGAYVTEITFDVPISLPHVESPWAEGETRHPHELEELAVAKPISMESSLYHTDYNTIKLRVASLLKG